MDYFHVYQASVGAIGALAVLMFIQLIAADVIGIKNKHIPGSAISSDHSNLLFRASRTVANSNESLGIFILAYLFAVLAGSDASIVCYAAWGFVATRLIYAGFYYFNLQTLRSISFVLVLIPIVTLLGAGASNWL